MLSDCDLLCKSNCIGLSKLENIKTLRESFWCEPSSNDSRVLDPDSGIYSYIYLRIEELK